MCELRSEEDMSVRRGSVHVLALTAGCLGTAMRRAEAAMVMVTMIWPLKSLAILESMPFPSFCKAQMLRG